MKSFILIGFLLCVILALSFAKEGGKCNNKEDCDDDECCVRLLRFAPARCKKLKQKGDKCFTDKINEVTDDGIYSLACPCAGGLQCKPSKEKDENDIVTFLNERCQ